METTKRLIPLLVLMLIFACPAYSELPSATDIVIKQALSSGKPAVIDLGARSCHICKKMAPILESLSAEYRGKASVLFIDIHKDPSTAEKFRIQMIPTQIFFDAKGKEVKRHVGFMEKADIVKEMKALGVK